MAKDCGPSIDGWWCPTVTAVMFVRLYLPSSKLTQTLVDRGWKISVLMFPLKIGDFQGLWTVYVNLPEGNPHELQIYDHMSSRQNQRKTKVAGSGLGMFKFVRKHSQPIGDHPLWPCPLRVVSNFVRHSYGGFLKWGYPQIIHFQMVFSMK